MTKQSRTAAEDHGMLSSIRLRNFKCYKDSGAIPLAPLTVILGCNNSGKSTITQPILALNQTLRDISGRPRLITVGQMVDLGGFLDIIHRGCKNVGDGVTVEFTRDPRDKSVGVPKGIKFEESMRLSITFSFNAKAKNIEVRNIEFRDDKQEPILKAAEPGTWTYRGLDKKQQRFLRMTFV